MPSKIDAPVLTVDVALIHKVDTRNVENLFSMWSVFSRCADSLEEGRRLENLSWRLWNRETFCCDPVSEANSTTPAISISSRSSEGRYSVDIPSLSGSVDSIVDEEAIDYESDNSSPRVSAPLDICQPQIRRPDSVHSRSRGRERHITPDDLEKMVITIKEKKELEPLSLNCHTYFASAAATASTLQHQSATDNEVAPTACSVKCTSIETKAPSPEVDADAVVSTNMVEDLTSNQQLHPRTILATSAAADRSATSVVKGFSPSRINSSYRSTPRTITPSSIPTVDITAVAPKAPHFQKSMFAIGGSSGDDSMSDQARSVETALHHPSPRTALTAVVDAVTRDPAPTQSTPPIKKKSAMFSFGGSSNEDESSLPQKRMKGSTSSKSSSKKQTSFQEEVAKRTIREEAMDDDVFETDDEEEVDESAIDDEDDSSDWEDSVEDSGNGSVDDKNLFQRVDSRPQLTSRRSLITTMLHQNDRKQAMASAAMTPMLPTTMTPPQPRSRTVSLDGPSTETVSETHDVSLATRGLKSIAEIPRSEAQPIHRAATSHMTHQAALSPRTTRRNMLASELTVSLRQHLLWERKQKSQTANAVLKRRHTAHDVANLKQYPEMSLMGKEDMTKITWNEYYGDGLGEYHSRGW